MPLPMHTIKDEQYQQDPGKVIIDAQALLTKLLQTLKAEQASEQPSTPQPASAEPAATAAPQAPAPTPAISMLAWFPTMGDATRQTKRDQLVKALEKLAGTDGELEKLRLAPETPILTLERKQTKALAVLNLLRMLPIVMPPEASHNTALAANEADDDNRLGDSSAALAPNAVASSPANQQASHAVNLPASQQANQHEDQPNVVDRRQALNAAKSGIEGSSFWVLGAEYVSYFLQASALGCLLASIGVPLVDVLRYLTTSDNHQGANKFTLPPQYTSSPSTASPSAASLSYSRPPALHYQLSGQSQARRLAAGAGTGPDDPTRVTFAPPPGSPSMPPSSYAPVTITPAPSGSGVPPATLAPGPGTLTVSPGSVPAPTYNPSGGGFGGNSDSNFNARLPFILMISGALAYLATKMTKKLGERWQEQHAAFCAPTKEINEAITALTNVVESLVVLEEASLQRRTAATVARGGYGHGNGGVGASNRNSNDDGGGDDTELLAGNGSGSGTTGNSSGAERVSGVGRPGSR